MSTLNYEQDLAIDETALDLEWLGQSMLMIKYVEASASARREVDRMKERLSVKRAELAKNIRKNPGDWGIEKVTNDSVNECIITEKSYKDVQDDLIDAQYEYQMASGAVQAVEQRKQALENMSKLLGLQYFAGPKTPRDLPHEVQLEQKKNRSNESVTITRRRKK